MTDDFLKLCECKMQTIRKTPSELIDETLLRILLNRIGTCHAGQWTLFESELPALTDALNARLIASK